MEIFKNKFIIFLSTIIIISTVFNVIFYRDTLENLKTAEKDSDTVKNELQVSQAITSSMEELIVKEGEVKSKYTAMCDLFPKSIAQENTLNILKTQSDNAKVNITNLTFDALEPAANNNGFSMTVKFSYKGSYTNVRNFLDFLNKNKEKVAVKQFAITGFGKNLTGNAVVTFYSYKNSISGLPGYEIESEGKEDLFSIFSGAESFVPEVKEDTAKIDNTTNTASKENPFADVKINVYSDIYIILNRYNDDAANIIVGRNKNNEISASGNKTNWVNLYFVTRNGKSYFRYRTEKNEYPINNVIEEFIPLGNTIIVNVQSNSIISNKDTSKMMLNVYNDSNKKVVVNVSGDNKRVIKHEFNGDVEIKSE